MPSVIRRVFMRIDDYKRGFSRIGVQSCAVLTAHTERRARSSKLLYNVTKKQALSPDMVFPGTLPTELPKP